MAEAIGGREMVLALLLVKAVLATLAVLLFVYYRMNWERAKRHIPVHFFFAKWRAVRHAIFLGIAAMGFAIGFSVELIGVQYGLSENLSRAVSGIFEAGSLLAMLYVFFTLAIEDVPSFRHIAESARKGRHAHHAQPAHAERPAASAVAKGGKKAQRRQKRIKGRKRK